MENNLQTNIERPELGAGIITIAVLHFIGIFFVVTCTILVFSFKDVFQRFYPIQLTESALLFPLAIQVIILAGLILVLKRKKLGVYMYYTGIVLTLISNVAFNGGLTLGNIIAPIILPIIMVFFLKKKFKYYT